MPNDTIHLFIIIKIIIIMLLYYRYYYYGYRCSCTGAERKLVRKVERKWNGSSQMTPAHGATKDIDLLFPEVHFPSGHLCSEEPDFREVFPKTNNWFWEQASGFVKLLASLAASVSVSVTLAAHNGSRTCLFVFPNGVPVVE